MEHFSENTRYLNRQWATLQIMSVYRFSLSLILIFLWVFDVSSIRSHQNWVPWYGIISLGYVLVSFLGLIGAFWRSADIRFLAIVGVFIDIFFLTLMMATSGGINYGFGILVNASIAGGSILVVGRLPVLFAAVASIAVLVEHALSQPASIFSPQGYAEMGILGGTFFVTSIVAYGLSRRIRESEALASQRSLDVAKLEKLNEMIVQRMRSGVILLDENDSVRLINKSAWFLLGVPIRSGTLFVHELSQALSQQLSQWKRNPRIPGQSFQTSLSSQGVLAEFTRLDIGKESGYAVLIFLEDSARVAQQVQQMKLASLGRLTASIAHEIRNPLGAISHAGQLLAESNNTNSDDSRLTDIIRLQCSRMNEIIENILQLSRRKEAAPQMIRLKAFLHEFIPQLLLQYTGHPEINIKIYPEDLELFMDKSQFQQVLTNLCENGLRVSKEKTGKYMLDLEAGIMMDTHQPYLDVIDFGGGVSPDIVDYIFEPFFTTKSGGTGLGLYIARELCEANQASLVYYPIEAGGSCFRIIFSKNTSYLEEGDQ